MPSVLIVDDDQVNCTLVKHILQRAGIDVMFAYNGDDGMSAVVRGGVDLVIVDVFLPQRNGSNGIELVRQLRQNPMTADLPIISLTAAPTTQLERDALAAGADMFLTKPFNPEQLTCVVHRLLGVKP